nr:odorant receptor 85b-like [Osmia lignaria]
MRKPVKNSIDYYILPNKILCSMYGMWPSIEESSTWRTVLVCFHLVFSLIIVCFIYVPEIIIVARNWNDLKAMTGAGCIVLSLTQLVFKTFYLIAKKEKAHTVYNELRSLWATTDDPLERQSYEMFAYWARTCTIVFFVSSISTATMFMISGTFDYIKDMYTNNGTESTRHLPYDVWNGIDSIRSPDFEIIFAGQMAASFTCCFAICGLDCTCMTAILHLSGQFRLISTWFINIGIKMNCRQLDYSHNSPSNLATELIKCIRHHQRLINVVNEVNDLLTPIIFVQLLTSGVEICLSGFVVISNDAGNDLIKFISYLLSMSIQLLLFCWPGEILIQESQEIGCALYLNVPWYKLPPICRRQLSLVILRSQKYCTISALTFQAMSIHTLTAVLNTAASYFALLRQIQEQST